MSEGLDDQERQDCVKPRNTNIPGGLYTSLTTNLTLATASSLDGLDEIKKKKKEEGEEGMFKDETMAKGEGDRAAGRAVSPYSGSKIDPGVLELK